MNKLYKSVMKEVKKVDVLRQQFEKEEKILLKKFKEIDDRINHIINKLAEIYKISAESWSYNNCGFDEHHGEYDNEGCFESKMLLGKDFYVCVNFSDIDSDCDDNGLIKSELMIDGKKYDPFRNEHSLGSNEICFPTKWIFEDFEKNLEKTRILYELSK